MTLGRLRSDLILRPLLRRFSIRPPNAIESLRGALFTPTFQRRLGEEPDLPGELEAFPIGRIKEVRPGSGAERAAAIRGDVRCRWRRVVRRSIVRILDGS